MTTIYFEAGIPATLIPVQFVGWARRPAHDVTGLHNAVIRLKRSAPGYLRGEVLHVPAYAVVVKSRRRDYRQLVKPAPLPPVDPATVTDSRV